MSRGYLHPCQGIEADHVRQKTAIFETLDETGPAGLARTHRKRLSCRDTKKFANHGKILENPQADSGGGLKGLQT